MQHILRNTILAVLGATLLVSVSCGHHNKAPTAGASPHVNETASLTEALAELDVMQVPEGVKPEVFQQLKHALAKALRARGTNKITSAPPTGDINKVNDFAISDHGDG
jgi:hypothetical protein